MNRREMLATVGAALVASKVEGKVEAIDPDPILLVVECDEHLDMETRRSIRIQLHEAFLGKPHPPIVVLRQGMTIRAVRESDADIRKITVNPPKLTEQELADMRRCFDECNRGLGRLVILHKESHNAAS